MKSHKMNIRRFSFFIIALFISYSTFCQPSWGTQERYITKNKKPVYLSGVNYIISDRWLINLPNLSKEDMDRDMSALANAGVNHIRFFPLWSIVQPEIGRLDENVLKKLDLLTESAEKYNISMQLAPLTGWMSGAVFLPGWANGDIFRDPQIIEGEIFLCKTIARRYAGNPTILGYDFGNELNVLASKMEKITGRAYTRDEITAWMKKIYSALKQADSDKLVTNGIGTGYDNLFDIRIISPNVDYMAPHSYAYFMGTSKLDPWYGQRTTYSTNFIVSWCEMMGKPSLVQEIGCSDSWLPDSKIGDYLRLNYMSAWADGAAGFLWWSSHNIDTTTHLKASDIILSMSGPSFQNGRFSSLEYKMGLLNTDNTPKSCTSSFTESVKTVSDLGLSWIDEVPVCYIIVPDNQSFDALLHKYITAYAFAKQAHFDVKICYQGLPIPHDASAVIIPGLKLNTEAIASIMKYLSEGGVVYQSYENDFGNFITTGKDTLIHNPSLLVTNRVGNMEYYQKLNASASVRFRKATCTYPAKSHIIFQPDLTGKKKSGDGVFFSQPVGKGTYYYFSGDIETSFSEIYNPWENTNFELLYTSIKPGRDFEIDNKYVEFYNKTNGKNRMVLLLNHSAKYQNVTIRSKDSHALINFETKKDLGSGKKVTLLMRPAEVLVIHVL